MKYKTPLKLIRSEEFCAPISPAAPAESTAFVMQRKDVYTKREAEVDFGVEKKFVKRETYRFSRQKPEQAKYYLLRLGRWLQLDIFVFQPESKPGATGSIRKDGAKERADDVLLFHRNKRTSQAT